MLSYQHNTQPIVKEVYNVLIKQFPVWMDIHGGIENNLYTNMAEGIENAAVVVCFCTKAYQTSYNCERELTHAATLERHIIPVICDPNYTQVQTGDDACDQESDK